MALPTPLERQPLLQRIARADASRSLLPTILVSVACYLVLQPLLLGLVGLFGPSPWGPAAPLAPRFLTARVVLGCWSGTLLWVGGRRRGGFVERLALCTIQATGMASLTASKSLLSDSWLAWGLPVFVASCTLGLVAAVIVYFWLGPSESAPNASGGPSSV
jgi:hypothetical protein